MYCSQMDILEMAKTDGKIVLNCMGQGHATYRLMSVVRLFILFAIVVRALWQLSKIIAKEHLLV